MADEGLVKALVTLAPNNRTHGESHPTKPFPNVEKKKTIKRNVRSLYKIFTNECNFAITSVM